MFEQGMIIQERYEIIEEVGNGGMSVVFKAMDHTLNRFVAMKVLKPEFADDTSFITKFRIEAQSAAGLSHPNIVNVFDVGEFNGDNYIVMELVEGITLKEYIQQNGRLPYATALDFIIQITSGIEAAHESRTIHRDIKPQNVIVSKTGNLKVTDFGIAKAATSNTIASSAMGSVHYISPEQARGGYSDERSDIYSLGITFYEMLTGRVPFEGENNVTVALMHIQSEIIPPREYYPDIPVGLEKIVLKATQKKPELRYLTASAMLADLRKFQADPMADVGNVGIHSSMAEGNPTIQISDEELNTIKSATAKEEGLSMFPVDERRGDRASSYDNLYEEYDEDEYEYDEEYDEDDDDDYDDDRKNRDDGDIDPKVEKMITIGAIVATVIIALIIIIAIASIGGAFKGHKTTTELSTEMTSRMIDVVGLSEEDAKKALDEAKLEYEIEYEYSDSFEEGKVSRQDPREGTVLDKDTKITIYVSKGEDLVAVPDVTGKTAEDAKTLLTSAGFVVSEQEEYDEEVEEGKVIRYSPSGQAKKGDTITLYVSKGEEVKVVKVPDLKGKTITEAESALSTVKLKLGNVTQEYDDTVEEGKVITQSVATGTEVKEGSKVDITISKGKKPVNTTYTATFSGTLNNVSYSFEEGEQVYVTITLRVDDASYTLVSNWFGGSAFPLQFSQIAAKSGLTSKNASLVYSVKNENGEDVTGNFTSNGQATLTPVEQQ